MHALHTEMQFEVQEFDGEDKPAVDVKKPEKWLLEDPIHKGSVLPGFHLAKDPLKKKPWYAYCTNLMPRSRGLYSSVLKFLLFTCLLQLCGCCTFIVSNWSLRNICGDMLMTKESFLFISD